MLRVIWPYNVIVRKGDAIVFVHYHGLYRIVNWYWKFIKGRDDQTRLTQGWIIKQPKRIECTADIHNWPEIATFQLGSICIFIRLCMYISINFIDAH